MVNQLLDIICIETFLSQRSIWFFQFIIVRNTATGKSVQPTIVKKLKAIDVPVFKEFNDLQNSIYLLQHKHMIFGNLNDLVLWNKLTNNPGSFVGSFLLWLINFKLSRLNYSDFILDNRVLILNDWKFKSYLVVNILGKGVNNQNLVVFITFLQANVKVCIVFELLQWWIFKGCEFIIVKAYDSELV